MKRLIALLIVALATPAFAETQDAIEPADAYAFSKYADGVHYLAVTIVDGQITKVGSLKITVLPAPTDDPKDDPTDPDDPKDPADPLAKKVAALIASAPENSAGKNERAAVAKVFETTGEFETDKPLDIRKAMKFTMGLLPLGADWKTWVAEVDGFASSLGIADVKRTWKLIAEGIVK